MLFHMRSLGERSREFLVRSARYLETRAYKTRPFSRFSLSESEVLSIVHGHQERLAMFRESWEKAADNGLVPYSWPSPQQESRIDFLGQHLCLTEKKSAVDWTHGYLLSSVVRQVINPDSKGIICDFGTARGFSAIAMGEAVSECDANVPIFTFDILPHDKKMFWNSPADNGGPQSRREIWKGLSVDADIVFFEGPISSSIDRIKNPRILVAFLDSQHSLEQVEIELMFVIRNQSSSGGIIIFDDYGSNGMEGVKKAAEKLLPRENYSMQFEISTGHKNLAVWSRT